METITGFSEGKAVALAMNDADLAVLFTGIAEIAKRRLFGRKKSTLSSWHAVLDYLSATLSLESEEQFRVLFLNKRNGLIADECMGKGTVDHCPVYPREVLRRAIELRATAVILAHNHPSGDVTPSAADIAMTQTLANTLKILGIAVHDHVVIGGASHASFRALGLL